MTAVDNQTVVIKLKEPVSTIFARLAGEFPGLYFIVPKEADGGFNANAGMNRFASGVSIFPSSTSRSVLISLVPSSGF